MTLADIVNAAKEKGGKALSDIAAAFTQAARDASPYPPEDPRSWDDIGDKALDVITRFMPLQTVYHGSPHVFDKFDLFKIGTGEGAQAYGHGLYFADNPQVAKNYQTQLAKSQIDIGGKSVMPAELSEQIYKSAGRDDPAFLRGVMDAVHEMTVTGKAPTPPADLSGWVGYGPMAQREGFAHASGILGSARQSAGSLYKVDIPDEAIGKMLQWDLPLSQQPESVRKALANAPFETGGGDWTGRQILDAAQHYASATGRTADPQAGSALLRELGIPGIRYLDQGSRTGGQGTYNTVLFDDALARILSRE